MRDRIKEEIAVLTALLKATRLSWFVILFVLSPILLVLFTSPLGGLAAGEAGENLRLAPLNPRFEDYWDNPPDTSYGYIPAPVNVSHLGRTSIQEAQLSVLSLPSRFDWRDTGNVTAVKNQGSCGTCWIFGTTTVLESAALISEGVTYDFSEQSVALCVDRSWVYLYDDPVDPCDPGG